MQPAKLNQVANSNECKSELLNPPPRIFLSESPPPQLGPSRPPLSETTTHVNRGSRANLTAWFDCPNICQTHLLAIQGSPFGHSRAPNWRTKPLQGESRSVTNLLGPCSLGSQHGLWDNNPVKSGRSGQIFGSGCA